MITCAETGEMMGVLSKPQSFPVGRGRILLGFLTHPPEDRILQCSSNTEIPESFSKSLKPKTIFYRGRPSEGVLTLVRRGLFNN